MCFFLVFFFRFLDMNRWDLTGLPRHFVLGSVSAQHTLKKWRPDIVFYIVDQVVKARDLNSDIRYTVHQTDLKLVRPREKLKRLYPKIYGTYNHMRNLIDWDNLEEPMKTTMYEQIAELNVVMARMKDMADELFASWDDCGLDEDVTRVIEQDLSTVHAMLIK